MRQDLADMTRWPIVRAFMPHEHLNRVSPFFWIFLFAIVFLILGVVIPFLEVLAWIGGFVVIVFTVYVLAVLKGQI